jgi:type II secretory pathway pseudopilin PulG
MSDVLLTESKALKADESVSLIGATLKPGSYSVFITNTASGERVIASLSIKGQYADIENVAIYKNEDGKTASTITVLANSYKNKNMSITLKGSDGVVCISQDKPLNEPVVSFDNLATCSQGTAVITIKDVQGAVLATKTQSFDVQPIRVVASILQDKEMAAFRKECLYQLVGGIFGILAVIAFVVILRRRAAGTLAIALFLLYGLTGTYQTHALTQWAYLMDTAMGEFSWQCHTTTSVDKSSYVPGETALVTTSPVDLNSDSGASADDGNCQVYYYQNIFNTAPAFDAESLGTVVNYADTGDRPRVPKLTRVSGNFSFIVPVSMLAGGHTVRFIKTDVAGGTSGSPGGSPSVNAPLPFTVGAATPVVQIYFTP